MTQSRELELLRFVHGLRTQLSAAHDEAAAARAMLRATRRVFAASAVALVTLDAGERPRLAWSAGTLLAPVDAGLRAYLVHGEWPRPAANRLLAPLERRGRRWGVLVADAHRDFAAGEGHALVLVAGVFAERVQELDRQRASEVRARIDRKIMAQLRPLDLCYQILHGLRSLTGYDHSGSLYVREGGAAELRLAAEQVAWSKRKSDRIGLRVELRAEDLAVLRGGDTCGFDLAAGAWRAWRGAASPELARALDLGPQVPGAGSMLLAPLVAGPDLLGAIKLASARPGRLASYEADLLHRFLPQASIAIRNAEKTESLRESVLRAERKYAMADLARGVAHDVNNALGAVLPLVQQLQADLRDGALAPDTLRGDLERVEQAVAACRRIFTGMLAFAKGAAARGARRGDVRRALDSAGNLVAAMAARHGIALDLQVPESLPPVAAAQHELVQLFLNLMTNACEATARGGRVQVVVEAETVGPDQLAVRVVDDGRGMTRAELLRVEEAFYTTKTHGNGLGLAICRSIVGDIGARMTIASEPGAGTTVAMQLPVLAQRPSPEVGA